MKQLAKRILLSATILTSALGLTACQQESEAQPVKNSNEATPEAVLDSGMWRDDVRAKLYVVDGPFGESSLIGENPEGISSAFITKAADHRSDFAPQNTTTLSPTAILDSGLWREGLEAKVYEIMPNNETLAVIVENPDGISLDAVTIRYPQQNLPDQNTAVTIDPDTTLTGSMWRKGLQAKVYYYETQRIPGYVAVISENPDGISVDLTTKSSTASFNHSSEQAPSEILGGAMWRDDLKAKHYQQGNTIITENPEGVSVKQNNKASYRL